MERAQFVDVDGPGWWLLERDLQPTLEVKRQALGESWGWAGDTYWYTSGPKLEEVFQFLQGSRPDLLLELDTDQELYKREQWLDDLIDAKGGGGEEEDTEEETDPPADAEGPAAAAEAPASPKKGSLFARREPEPAEEPPPSDAAPADSDAPTAPAASEPKKGSLFAKKAAPVAETPPASEVEAEEVEAEGPATVSGAEPAVVDEEQLQEISQQVETVMAEMPAEELARIAADLGLTVDEVKAIVRTPDFASRVAKEQGRRNRAEAS